MCHCEDRALSALSARDEAISMGLPSVVEFTLSEANVVPRNNNRKKNHVSPKNMILGAKELLKLVKEKRLVENLSERELKNPEGAGFDLRLGELYEISGQGFLGIEERETPKTKLLAKYNSEKKQSFAFVPGKYYLMKTIEKVNLPENILCLLRQRSTLHRSGIMIFTANVSPGYHGALTFGIVNLGPCEIKIELGARVVYAMFHEVKGETNLYRGQWQGGRVSTNQKEKQI